MASFVGCRLCRQDPGTELALSRAAALPNLSDPNLGTSPGGGAGLSPARCPVPAEPRRACGARCGSAAPDGRCAASPVGAR